MADTYGAWRDTPHPDEAVDLVLGRLRCGQPDECRDIAGHAPSAVAWGARLQADAYYANDQVFAVEVAAAEFSDPAYVSLRFSIPEAVSEDGQRRDPGRRHGVDALPALQEELVNQAQLKRLHRAIARRFAIPGGRRTVHPRGTTIRKGTSDVPELDAAAAPWRAPPHPARDAGLILFLERPTCWSWACSVSFPCFMPSASALPTRSRGLLRPCQLSVRPERFPRLPRAALNVLNFTVQWVTLTGDRRHGISLCWFDFGRRAATAMRTIHLPARCVISSAIVVLWLVSA